MVRQRRRDAHLAPCRHRLRHGELVSAAPRVNCPVHGPTVIEVPWARHDSWFSRAFEDVIVFDAICSNKLGRGSALRHQLAGGEQRLCPRRHRGPRPCRPALGARGHRDRRGEVQKGQRYLTVVCDHLTGKVIWAAKGRTKDTVNSFFDALGEERVAKLQFVTCDGAEWIRTVVQNALRGACLPGHFHLIEWATAALDEVAGGVEPPPANRRSESRQGVKGLRWLLLRNWENLSPKQKGTIRELEQANKRTLRAWQLKEELRDIMSMPFITACRALDDGSPTRAVPDSLPS